LRDFLQPFGPGLHQPCERWLKIEEQKNELSIPAAVLIGNGSSTKREVLY
jgi:hypothetical protein